jgi:hypothetical protein
MRSTRPYRFPIDPLDPRGVVCLLALALLWAACWLLPVPEGPGWHAASRLCGYAALAAFAVPYVHILLRTFRSAPGWAMSTWLRLHIACSYAGLGLLLLHCHARATSPLTLALVWLTWAVMLSGAAGFYGQKLLYAALAESKSLPREVGLERLEPERAALLAAGRDLAGGRGVIGAGAAVREFVAAVIDSALDQPFRLLPDRREQKRLKEIETRHEQAKLMAEGHQREAVNMFWGLAETRRQLNREYRFHHLGRLWLLAHGPAAWALLVLVIEHLAVSLWYGGF